MIFMQLLMSPGIAFTSSVIVWILTTSYCWTLVEISLSIPLSQRRTDSPQRGLFAFAIAHRPCLSTTPNMPGVKIPTDVFCVSSPIPAQQRGAERPALSPLYFLISKPLPPALVTPATPFHRSAHRSCAGIRPRLPGSTPSRGIPSANLEAL